MSATCSSCGAPVRWVETPKGRRMTRDFEPCADGSVVVRHGVGFVVSRLSSVQPRANEPRYLPHWATCPHAVNWRKPDA